MKRKDFIRNTLLGFASLLLPEVLRPIDFDGRKCAFDENKLNERLEYLRKNPLEASECYPPEWTYKYQIVTTKNLHN